MNKPRLFIRDWDPWSPRKTLRNYFDVDVFEDMIYGKIEEYDGFLLHHFSYVDDMEPLRNIFGVKPIVIETTCIGEKKVYIETLVEDGIDFEDINIITR